MPADYKKKVHRLLRILTLIQGDAGWNVQRLAAEFGCTERSVYRDLQVLGDIGIPYFFDEESGGYRIRRDFFMPPVSLTLEESLALVALAEHVGGQEQIPFTHAAGKAIEKVRCSLPHAMRDELDRIGEHLTMKLSPVNPPEASEDVYERVRFAIASRRVLCCKYSSPTYHDGEGEDEFDFDPYTLFFCRRAWYAIGRHSGRDGLRCLKLGRFTQYKLTHRVYEIPAGFSVQEHLGNAWHMIRGRESHEVELCFDAEFAETISDTCWHRTQQIIDQEDGSILFRCTVDGLDEIVWWVLSMGPHCIVRQPAELAGRVRDLAAAVVQHYPVKDPLTEGGQCPQSTGKIL
jgi:predicted DNA-binding transcriptional regulator YafY